MVSASSNFLILHQLVSLSNLEKSDSTLTYRSCAKSGKNSNVRSSFNIMNRYKPESRIGLSGLHALNGTECPQFSVTKTPIIECNLNTDNWLQNKQR